MKRIFSLFLLLCCTTIIFAQKTISGKVTDSDGQPIPSASVTVEVPGSDAILAYGISNAKGEYKVTFNSATSGVDLKVKAFNQKTITKSVTNDNQNLNFEMESQATEIQEVKIKTKLITKRGDTISYDLKSFESQSDRTLADVLKKMPGIEVNTDGSILYQGEPLQKFMVNGKDIMEGGYGALNKALPKDAVSKVEILENHQPIKILQDKIPSDKASINIKLKKNVTMTGRGEVGVGMDPFLWNVKLTPMFFGQKNQWVVNYKTNNNGESVENDANMLGGFNRWEGRRSQASPKRWLSTESAGTPSVPEKRYLFNNVHFFSANILTNPFKNKEWELKANANYANNSVEREDSNVRIYEKDSPASPNGGEIRSSKSNNFYSNALKGELIFSKNAKKGFFKNTTTWNSFWNDTKALVETNTTTGSTPTSLLANEVLNSPSGVFQNSMSTILPWKEKLINVMSYISFQNDKQTLLVDPASYMDFGGSYELGKQYAKSTTTMLNHSASVGFSHKNWTFTPEVGLDISLNKLQSELFGINGNTSISLGDKYINDNEWNEVKPYGQLGVNYKANNLNVNLMMPFNFYGITYKDNFRNNELKTNKLAFEPNLFASYEFASFFTWRGFASQNYSLGNFGFLYQGEMYTNPLNSSMRFGRTNSDITMPEYINRNVGTRLEYRNPLNNLFFNVRMNYNTNKRNIMESIEYDPEGLRNYLTLNPIENTLITRSQGAEIGKYFPKFKTNASVGFSNSNSRSYAFVNDIIQKIIVERQGLNFKVNNNYLSWFSVDYSASLNWTNNHNLYRDSVTKSTGWNHNLAAYFYPIKNHTFGFFWDDMASEVAGLNRRNSFYDISYQFTWDKKKIDFELKWLNIGNTKTFETISYNPELLLTSKSMMAIRPSQVMFTVKFNFK